MEKAEDGACKDSSLQDKVAEGVLSDEAQSDTAPPPIPERVSWTSSQSLSAGGPAPPLPPRSRPPSSHNARGLPSIAKQSALPDQPKSAPSQVKWLPRNQAVARTTTLKELSENPENLPVVFRFVDGYYGQTSRFTVSAGDYFLAHFMKLSQVLNLQSIGRKRYSVPLTSTMKLGLLLEDNEDELCPMSVAGLLTMKRLPHVLCVVTESTDKKGRKLASEGDLLIVRERKQKALKCFNLATQSEVLIPKSFTGTFSLDPDATKMYPLEIANHLPDMFPCRAKVYQEGTSCEQGSALRGKEVILSGCSTEVCVVAKVLHPEREEGGSIVHFPTHGNLSKLHVQVLHIDDKQHLYEDAHKLLQNFNPAAGITYSDVETDVAFDTQLHLYQNIRLELREAEAKLLTSEILKKEVSRHLSSAKECEAGSRVNPEEGENRVTNVTKSLQPETNQSGPEYEFIDSLFPPLLKARPAVKPRRPGSLSSPPTPPLPAKRSTKRPAGRGLTASAVVSDEEGEYMTIPDTLLSSKSAPRPPVKPRPQLATSTNAPALKPPLSGTQENLLQCPDSSPTPTPPGGYTTLHPASLLRATDEYDTIPNPPSRPPTVPPLPTPRSRNTTVKDRTQEENKAFLKTLTPAQVNYAIFG